MEKILECRVLTNFAELEKLSSEWAELQSTGGRREIFQQFGWIRSWWHAYGRQCRLSTPVVTRGGQVVAILPLILAGRRLRFIGHSASDYNDILSAPEQGAAALEICLDSLGTHETGWDEIHFENVPEASRLAEAIRRHSGRWRSRIVEAPGDPCPTLLMAGNGRESLKHSMDKLKRAVNRLRRQDQLSFRHIDHAAEAAEHLPEFFRQHIRRSAIAGRRSGFLEDAQVEFYRDLLKRFDGTGEIRFSVLELGGRAVAYHFGSLLDGKYFWYKPSFDVDLWEQAPGQVILWHLLEYSQAAGVEEFDFGRGDEAFKHRFANHVRHNLNFTVYRPGIRLLARRMRRGLRQSLRSRIRRSPAMERALMTILTNWQGMRRSLRQRGPVGMLGRLLGEAIHGREDWCIVSDGAIANAIEWKSRVEISEIALGGLADLAMDIQDVLTEDALLQARKLLREEWTAWTARIDGRQRAILWTAAGRDFPLPAGSPALPHDAMIVSEIWPLDRGLQGDQVIALLQQFAGIARGRNRSLCAICPRRMMPSPRVLRDAGFRILGKTHSRRCEIA